MVIRDKGWVGSGCYYGVMIDQVLSARIDVSEQASFHLEPGAYILKFVRDPQGRALCGYGNEKTEKQITLQAQETQKYRLTTDLTGIPRIKPYSD